MTDHNANINEMKPPRELIEQWAAETSYDERDWYYETNIANRAAAWGADQQLEKDANWLDHNALTESHLRITPLGKSLKEAMRPKSLKEQAIFAAAVLQSPDETCSIPELKQHWQTIRRALESLDD